MPVGITEVDAFTPVVTAPVDGDAGTGASIVAGLQPLANRTLNLKNLLTTLGATVTAIFNTVSNSDILREIKAISGTGGLAAVTSQTLTGSFADVIGSEITLGTATQNDELHVRFDGTFFATNTCQPVVQIVVSSPSQSLVIAELGATSKVSMVATEYKVLSCAGKHVCQYSEIYKVKAQIKDDASSGVASLTGAWHLEVRRYDLTP